MKPQKTLPNDDEDFDPQEIADAAAASDRVVMEAYHWRYHPFVGMIRAALDSGVLLRTHRSNAKFGPPLIVLRYREIAFSHR
jgi:hypothetical protein